MRHKKYTARALYQEFRERHPDMWRRGSNAILVDHMKILIMAPGLGKFTWEWFGDNITWLEHWVDEKEVKLEEKTLRPKHYTYFIHLLEQFMECSGASQTDIARVTGVSRKSINEYLSGKSIPKISTMKKIIDILGLNMKI